MPQMWAKRFDPTELDLAHHGTAFHRLGVSIDQSGDQIIFGTMQDLQPLGEILRTFRIAGVSEFYIQQPAPRLLRGDLADAHRTAIRNAALTHIAGNHLPAVPAVGLQGEQRHQLPPAE